MTNVSNGFLIDTNVLVYAHDPRDAGKRQQAIDLLDLLVPRGQAVLSVQCLTEFFKVVTDRLPERINRHEALTQVERLARSCRVLDLTPGVVLEGCRGAVHHNLPIWDALIWAIAKLNQVGYVVTEDAEHGRFLEGVRFLNPFASTFDLSSLA